MTGASKGNFGNKEERVKPLELWSPEALYEAFRATFCDGFRQAGGESNRTHTLVSGMDVDMHRRHLSAGLVDLAHQLGPE